MEIKNSGIRLTYRLAGALAFGATLFAASAFAAENPSDVVVSITGFISCNEDSTGALALNKMGDLAINVISDLNRAKHGPVALVTGCFDQGKVDGADGRQLYFMLRTRDASGHETSQTIGLQKILTQTTGNSHQFDDLVTTVENSIRSVSGSGQPRLHFWGHSYGGWLSMRLVTRFANSNGGRLETLTTVDPISPTLCNVRTFINSGVFTAEGCTHRPYDLTLADQQEILQVMGGRWKNFYETQFHRLHSGPFEALEQSGQNFLIHLKNQGSFFNNYHRYIAEDKVVWGQIDQFVLANSQD